jgi:hypothetical protein
VAIAGGPDSDDTELAQLTGLLRRRLLELEVESVETLRSPEVTTGAKPGELKMLAVHLTPQALPSVVSLLTAWLKDRRLREVQLTIGADTLHLTVASHQDPESVVKAFLSKHTTKGPGS